MSQQFTIDALAFARDHGALEGVLPVAELTRVHDLLAEISGEVRFSVRGKLIKSVVGLGEPQLVLQIRGSLQLACQRCLGAIAFELDINSRFSLAPEDTEITQEELEDDSCDILPVAGALDVAALVEDEILLALPAAPRHQQCVLSGGDGAGERVSPFAVLSAMKGKPN